MASSKYADEGSAAHVVAAMCLTEGTDAAAYLGRLIELDDYEHAKLSPSGAKKWMTCLGSHYMERQAEGEFVPRSYSIEVTEEMVEYVQAYVDAVRARIEEYKLAGAVDVALLVEQEVSIEHLTGEKGATGTADVIILVTWADGSALAEVRDLKTGMGVEVEVEGNEQLQIYGHAVVEEHGLIYDIKEVRLVIHQPRIRAIPSEWTVPAAQLAEFGERVKKAAATATGIVEDKSGIFLTPGDHCRTAFCNARAICPKLAEFVQEGVGADFEQLEDDPHNRDDVLTAVEEKSDDALAAKMQAVDLIEDWCKAVRAEVERRLLAGTPVPGYKLVQGRKGARAWGDTTEVEATFKSMRLKQEEMYDFKLISPTTAEKLLKDSPRKWNRVLPLIVQREGGPSVAPESDKRPALVVTPVEDDFAVVTEGDDLAG